MKEASKAIGSNPTGPGGRAPLGVSGGDLSRVPPAEQQRRAREASSLIGSQRSTPGSEFAGHGVVRARANAGTSLGPVAGGLELCALNPLPKRNGKRGDRSELGARGTSPGYRWPCRCTPRSERGGGKRPNRRDSRPGTSESAAERRPSTTRRFPRPRAEGSPDERRPWWLSPPIDPPEECLLWFPPPELAPPSSERKTVRLGQGCERE